MKRTKRALTLMMAALMLVTLLAGCGSNAEKGSADADKTGAASTEKTEPKKLRVGFCAGPYEDMFKKGIEPSLKEKGYEVEYVAFSDYVQPNNALANNEIDVNMFQHSTYLNNFKKEHNLDLEYIAEIPTAGMGIFSNKIKSIADIPEGASVAIPNDPTNLTRALKVLEQAGVVKIDPKKDATKATEKDLSENPKKLKFSLIEAPQLPRSLDSTDVAVINGNYAISAGLNLADAIFNEELKEGYINVIAVRTADKDSQFAKDIVEILKTPAFKDVIEDPSGPYVSFQKPKDY